MVSKKSESEVGVLASQELKELIKKKVIHCDDQRFQSSLPDRVQPASVDLTLGSKAYRLQSSFLPQNHSVEDQLEKIKMYEVDLDKGGILEKNAVYLVPLNEKLDLTREENLKGKANPKSSTGRLDVFTRVITDKSHRFDDISSGYRGKLYLEIVPLSFIIKVKTGQTLNQLRLFKFSVESSGDQTAFQLPTDNDKYHKYLKGAELEKIFDNFELLLDRDRRVIEEKAKHITDDGILMSIDIKAEEGKAVGYKAKKNSRVLDLDKIGKYDSHDFWEPITANKGDYLILEPDEFYIFSSKEFIRIPNSYCAEMVEFDAGSGELRTHYAGFFDPGFGYGKEGEIKGTKAVLEVRPHNVPFRIEEGQILFKMRYERMLEKPDIVYGADIGSNYHDQTLKLSKLFI